MNEIGKSLTSPTDPIWAAYRAELSLDKSEIYLNAGSYSPVPKCVQAAAGRWRAKLTSSPMRTLIDDAPRALQSARWCLAEYIGVSPDNLLLVPNATHAVNIAARSLSAPEGSRVLMSDQEYGAMRFCWERIARERDWRIDVFSIPSPLHDEGQILDAIAQAVRPATRVVFFSHVTSPTGLILPAQAICAWARERGIATVIDGAHAPGMIPLNVAAVDADFYGGNCHKWMMAPIGAGFLAVNSEWKERVHPLVTSWGWEFSPEDMRDSGWGGSRWAMRTEFQGTSDRTAQWVLPETIEFRRALGDEAVRARTRYLSNLLRERFHDELSMDAIDQLETAGMLTAFPVEEVDPVKGREWFWRHHRMAIVFTQAANRTYLRVSTAWFTNEEEIDRLVKLIPTLPYSDLE